MSPLQDITTQAWYSSAQINTSELYVWWLCAEWQWLEWHQAVLTRLAVGNMLFQNQTACAAQTVPKQPKFDLNVTVAKHRQICNVFVWVCVPANASPWQQPCWPTHIIWSPFEVQPLFPQFWKENIFAHGTFSHLLRPTMLSQLVCLYENYQVKPDSAFSGCGGWMLKFASCCP